MHPSATTALLSLWNDIEAHRIDEYDRWHTLEHVPERVWVPGYVSGTRYVAVDEAQPRYFTLYELGNIDCLLSREYQDLVDNPSPWSRLMRPSFSNFLRKTGPIAAQAGNVLGSAVWLVRLVWPSHAAPAQQVLQRMVDHLLRNGAPFNVSRARLQRVVNAGPQALRNEDDAPTGDEFVGIIETFGGEHFDNVAMLFDTAQVAVAAPRPLWLSRMGTYRIASHVLHTDVTAPERPAPRVDLMP